MFSALFAGFRHESQALRNARARQAARNARADMAAECMTYGKARAADFQYASFGK